jgi:hypothetical protein
MCHECRGMPAKRARLDDLVEADCPHEIEEQLLAPPLAVERRCFRQLAAQRIAQALTQTELPFADDLRDRAPEVLLVHLGRSQGRGPAFVIAAVTLRSMRASDNMASAMAR